MVFVIGQKITIKKEHQNLIWRLDGETVQNPPQFGVVYLFGGYDTHFLNNEGLYLQDHPSGYFHDDGTPMSYNSDCWEAVIEKSTETGMAILRKLLEGEKISV